MRRGRIAVAVAVLVLAAGCGGDDDSSADNESERGGDAAITVTVGVPAKTPVYAPYFVAVAKGIFEDHNVTIDNVDFDGGSAEANAALAGGSIDVALTGPEQATLLQLAGEDVRIVVGLEQRELQHMVVRTELASEIQGAEDLAGRTIGVTALGSGSKVLTEIAVAEAGLDPKEDIDFIELGGDPGAWLAAFQGGQVDAGTSFEPATGILLKEGVAEFLPGQNWSAGEGPDIVQQTFRIAVIGRGSFIDDNRTGMERFVAAIVEAQEFLNDEANLQESLEIMVEAGVAPDLAAAEEGLRPFIGAFLPHVPEEAIDIGWDVLTRSGTLEPDAKQPSYDDLIDDVMPGPGSAG